MDSSKTSLFSSRSACLNRVKRVVDLLKMRIFERRYCSVRVVSNSETKLIKHLKSEIKLRGPITVADYMRHALKNPIGGYYATKQDVIGSDGDFITSPEISQMFGELIGVWCVHEWLRLGRPKPFQIVEFGPGNGTLMDDMCRVFLRFSEMIDNFSIHFIEQSSTLAKLQEKKLCASASVDNTKSEDVPYFNRNVTKNGVPIFWYTHVDDVPAEFTIYVAHEFLDALPIHKFQKVKDKWHEVLVDIDETKPNSFRYVLSHGPTPNSQVLISENETREHVEVGADAAILASALAERMERDGGFGLFIDYGHNGTKTDTFRAFKEHKLHDPLCDPGTADLTADVDFSYIRQNVQQKAMTFGPVTQEKFLKSMEIEARLQELLRANPKNMDELLQVFKKLTSPSEMGERFKAFSMFPLVLRECNPNFVPAGFH
uniref:Protein arginine methyltransferase NDUFAF7 n=1 Tax=Strigamia maritima TaxID=126957 RepID=T1JN65_STRMM